MFSLTALPLEFTAEAITPLNLGGERAGSNLRGALSNVMTRTYCTEPAARRAEPDHARTCPVCWLLAANEKPGEERRGYVLTQPRSTAQTVAPGQRFTFGITLLGHAIQQLPYWVLAVPEAGRIGLGAGRGQFALCAITARHPFGGENEVVLAEGENLVRSPRLLITHEHILAQAERYLSRCANPIEQVRVRLSFLSPTRLIEDKDLLKVPDFGVIFARLLKQVDDVNHQFSGGLKRGPTAAQALETYANQVRLLQAETHWVEVWSGSAHKAKPTPMGGFVGTALYSASGEVWRMVLPWMLWGQITHIGKNVVKGNGQYQVEVL